MAATGLVLYGFVVAHLVGNLQVYLGPEAINAYGKFLHEFLHGQGLYLARAVLLVSVLLHIWAAIALTLQNASARPVSTIRNASAWSLAGMMLMPRFCLPFSSVSHLMLVVPDVDTTVLPLRSIRFFTCDDFFTT